MDRTPEILYITAPAIPTSAVGVKLSIPLSETLHISEFGVFNDSATNAAGLVVQLRVLESDGSTSQVLATCTVTSATTGGTDTVRRLDAIVDKLNQQATVNGGPPSGLLLTPGGTRKFVAVQLNVLTVIAGTTGVLWVKARKAGTSGIALSAGESLVTI